MEHSISTKIELTEKFISNRLKQLGKYKINAFTFQRPNGDSDSDIYHLVVFCADRQYSCAFSEEELLGDYGSDDWKLRIDGKIRWLLEQVD